MAAPQDIEQYIQNNLPPNFRDITAKLSVPESSSYLLGNSFLLYIPRIPNVIYHCNKVNLPGINLSSVSQPTPVGHLKIPSETITYNSLTVNFLVDENLYNWYEIFNWIHEIAPTPAFGRAKSDPTTWYNDIQLIALSSQKRPVSIFQFFGAYPVTLADIQFDANVTSPTPTPATVTFDYTYYDVISGRGFTKLNKAASDIKTILPDCP
jgi:hypothetical protein